MNTRSYDYRNIRLVNAIAYVPGATPQFKKFRNIKNDRSFIERFEAYVIKTFPATEHINYYNAALPKGKNFIIQRKMKR